MDRLRRVRDALRLDVRLPEGWLVLALRVTLLLLIVHTLTLGPVTSEPWGLAATAALGLLGSLVFTVVPTKRPRTLRVAEAATLFAVVFHVAGHSFGLYDGIAFYDDVLHFLVPLVVALILYAMSQATRWIWNWRAVAPLEVGIYLFSMSLALGVLWEIVEFAVDQALGTNAQKDNFDTMVDLVMDTGGALVGAVAAALVTRHGRKRGMDEIAEEPKRADGSPRAARGG